MNRARCPTSAASGPAASSEVVRHQTCRLFRPGSSALDLLQPPFSTSRTISSPRMAGTEQWNRRPPPPLDVHRLPKCFSTWRLTLESSSTCSGVRLASCAPRRGRYPQRRHSDALFRSPSRTISGPPLHQVRRASRLRRRWIPQSVRASMIMRFAEGLVGRA